MHKMEFFAAGVPWFVTLFGRDSQTPYYSTVDATPLFLFLLGMQAAWTGGLDLFHEIKGHLDGIDAEAAGVEGGIEVMIER
jgi:glycogen debranching enzyme